LSALQHTLLRLLSHRPYTSSELSRKLHLDPATLVPVIDALERQGLVQRGRDPNDRRRQPLALTQSGADLLARLPIFDRSDALVVGLIALGDEPAQTLLQLLRELVGHMAPDADTSRELAATAHTARDMFRAQAIQTASRPTLATDDTASSESTETQ
jgi:DNA-binding MarR family transcriptional regulator